MNKNVTHNGQTISISSYPSTTPLSQVRTHASAKWSGVETATILVNGVEVSATLTVGELPEGASVTFRMPTGSKA